MVRHAAATGVGWLLETQPSDLGTLVLAAVLLLSDASWRCGRTKIYFLWASM